MNRTAVWILSAVSGVIMSIAVLSTLAVATGFTVSSSGLCTGAAAARNCTSHIDEVGFHIGRVLLYILAMLLLGALIGLPAWIASPRLAARREASSKVPIIIVSSLAILLVLLGCLPLVVSPILSSPKTCLSFGPQVWCAVGSGAPLLAAVGSVIVPLVLGVFVTLPAWTMALVRAADAHRRGWFVAILLLSPVATLLYGFLGPEQRQPTAS